MLLHYPMSREKYRRLWIALRTASAASYLPEYADEHDRNMNRRYYR